MRANHEERSTECIGNHLRPDLKGREQILRVHTKHVTVGSDADLTKIAARTPGFVGADLANIVNEDALHAVKDGKEALAMVDVDEAIDRVVGGLEKRNRVMNPKEKETVAYHEAGHAIVAEFRPAADRVSKVSIIPRGVAALGYTQQIPTEDRYLLKKSELLDRIDVLFGGRVAEERVIFDVSTGAQNINFRPIRGPSTMQHGLKHGAFALLVAHFPDHFARYLRSTSFSRL